MQTDIKKINTKTLQDILNACEKSFSTELNVSDFYGEGQTTWSIPEIGLAYKNTASKKDLLLFVENLTDTKSVRQAYAKIYEEVQARTSTTTDLPEYEAQNTTVTQGLEEKIEKAERREADILKTRENAQIEVERARARTEAIIKEQQKIQDQIAKSKLAQPKLDNAKIYANITIPEPPFLDENEQADFDTLRNYAENNKEELIEDLAEEIEAKLSKAKNEIAPEQIKLLARDQAEIIVEKIQNIEVAQKELPKIVQLAILDTVITDTTAISSVVSNKESLESIVHSSKILYNEASEVLLSHEIAENILGKKFALRIFGPGMEDVKVTFSTLQSENSVPVNLGQINNDATAVQERQNNIIEEAKNITVSEASKYVYSNTSTLVESKIASLPAGSKLKSVYSNPAVRGILSKYGMANPVEWQAYSKFGTSVLKYYPESAPYWSAFAQITGVSVGIGVVSKVVPMTFGGGAIPLARIVAIQPVKWVGVPYTYGIATGSKIAFGAGAKAAGQLAGKAAGTAVGAAAATAAGASGAEVGAAVGAVAGGGTPLSIVFAAIGTALGAVFGKILEKVNWAKVKKFVGEYVLPVAVGGGLVMFGAPVAGLVAGVLLFGVARGATLASITAGAFGVLGFIGSSIGIAIATPVIITILVIPPLVAFIMLVINNSAYVVPPGISTTGADNPYMLVTKTANPVKTSNPTSNTTVAYTVEIRALKSPLTNLRLVSAECNVIKKNNAKINCPPEDIPEFPTDLSISPTSAYSFTFFVNYDSGYSDALVYDTITIAADTIEESNIVTEGSASVCFGDCPQNCAKVVDLGDQWPSGLKNNMTIALSDISKYQGFTAKLCPKNEPVNLCYKPSAIAQGLYAWHVSNKNGDGCDVYFNSKGVSSPTDAAFMITHELTHHIQSINGSELVKYTVSGAYVPELTITNKGLCSYNNTVGDPVEAMAEAAALYVNSTPSWDACAGNYSSKYPKNFSWAQKFMTQ